MGWFCLSLNWPAMDEYEETLVLKSRGIIVLMMSTLMLVRCGVARSDLDDEKHGYNSVNFMASDNKACEVGEVSS